jgi:protein-S-isoprenylcysteine O-methyltransferase Ste14
LGAIWFGLAEWLVFMALDARRFGWSPTPLWAQVLGAALIVAALYAWTGVLRANSFAVTTLRLQPERGSDRHLDGPLRRRAPPDVRLRTASDGWHAVAPRLALGACGRGPAHALLAARALSEETMLTDGLPGYREYAVKVRFRLLPGVW